MFAEGNQGRCEDLVAVYLYKGTRIAMVLPVQESAVEIALWAKISWLVYLFKGTHVTMV